MAFLKLIDLVKTYQKGDTSIQAVNGVNIEFKKGEFSAIVGPSGSGKTTVLNLIGCLDTVTSGNVIFNDISIEKYSQKKITKYRKENIGFIFQSYNLIPVLSVKENIELALIITRKYSKNQIERKSIEMIEAVGLKGMENRRPKELSGGQEQRVAIARALVKDPLVVLADEPTANLDSKTAEDIIELMHNINKQNETTFIFSTHDQLMMKHAERLIEIKDGKVKSDKIRN